MRMKEKTRKTKSSFLQLKLEPIDLLMKAKKIEVLQTSTIPSSFRLFFQVVEKDANNI